MRSLLVALAFLTVLPIRFRTLPSLEIVARSRFWFPVVGLLLGAVLGAWTALAAQLHSSLLSAFLVLLAWVGLTGALHLDGFCDLCDGLFGGRTPEDRLRIMKDPRLGTFGLAAGVLLLLGKWVALQTAVGNPQGPWMVGAAVLVARCLVLCMAAGSRYPRPEGTGKVLVEAARLWEAGLFAVLAALATLSVVVLTNPSGRWPPSPGDWLWLTVLFSGVSLAVLTLTCLCRRRLGGVTGDCLGAAIETAEVTFLLIGAVVWNS